MSTLYPPLPLIFNDDSFLIEVEDAGPKTLRVLRITRFAHNQNTTGTDEHFFDLEPEVRRAMIKQINRRHVGRTILF